jgi:hypothetical protein
MLVEGSVARLSTSEQAGAGHSRDQRRDRTRRLATEGGFEAAMAARGTPGTPAAGDCHLRSRAVVTGYDIQATDGDIGHVKDVLVDDRTWAIRYLIVDTSNWWGGHDVLIAPQWIKAVSWPLAKVSVDLIIIGRDRGRLLVAARMRAGAVVAPPRIAPRRSSRTGLFGAALALRV